MSKQRKSRGFIPGFQTKPNLSLPYHASPSLAVPHLANACLTHAYRIPNRTTKVTSISPLPFSYADAVLCDTAHKGFLGLMGDSFPPDSTLARDDNGICEAQQANHNSDICHHPAHTPIGVTDATSQATSYQTRETNHPNRQLEITLPYPTLPRRTLPHPIRPFRAAPDPTEPCLTLPTSTSTTKVIPTPYLTLPYHARHCPTSPDHGEPDRTRPHLTGATKLFTHIKVSNHKPTKAGAIVTNTNGFASKGKHIVDNFKVKAVINNGDSKVKLPTRFERRANSNNAGTVDNHRTQVKVQRLITICIKLFRYFHIKGDFIRGNKYGRLEQVLIGLASLALNLEIDRRANHGTLEVSGGLKNTILVCVKILTPLLSVVNRASLLFATLAHRGEFGHREFVMQHRGSTNYGNINLIHGSPHRTHKAPYYVRRCLAIGRALVRRVVGGFMGTSFLVSLDRSIGRLNEKSPSFRLLDSSILTDSSGGVK